MAEQPQPPKAGPNPRKGGKRVRPYVLFNHLTVLMDCLRRLQLTQTSLLSRLRDAVHSTEVLQQYVEDRQGILENVDAIMTGARREEARELDETVNRNMEGLIQNFHALAIGQQQHVRRSLLCLLYNLGTLTGGRGRSRATDSRRAASASTRRSNGGRGDSWAFRGMLYTLMN